MDETEKLYARKNRQLQKITYYLIQFIQKVTIGKQRQKLEQWLPGTTGSRGGVKKLEVIVNAQKVSYGGGDENVLKLDVNGYATLYICPNCQNVHLNKGSFGYGN